MNKCSICKKLKNYLKRLIAKGEFQHSPRESLDCEDLYSKYLKDGKFRMYIEGIRLCPDCGSWYMGARGANFEQNKHYHICDSCNWKSPFFNGKYF
ncbi:hypothetical protein J4458_03325 [Candidatus Woesearchaeota archaeon]|nr:hypothetical protein [Candidatus Woesearchaeota archaeon]